MGAFISICNPIESNILTCVTSFVVRVIKLLVENFFISSIPKSITLLNISFLKFLEKDDAIKDITYPTITADTREPKAQSNIFPPGIYKSLTLVPSV